MIKWLRWHFRDYLKVIKPNCFAKKCLTFNYLLLKNINMQTK